MNAYRTNRGADRAKVATVVAAFATVAVMSGCASSPSADVSPSPSPTTVPGATADATVSADPDVTTSATAGATQTSPEPVPSVSRAPVDDGITVEVHTEDWDTDNQLQQRVDVWLPMAEKFIVNWGTRPETHAIWVDSLSDGVTADSLKRYEKTDWRRVVDRQVVSIDIYAGPSLGDEAVVTFEDGLVVVMEIGGGPADEVADWRVTTMGPAE